VEKSKITRRYFLKTLGTGVAAITSSPAYILSSNNSEPKPNIILILTDDQGTIDVNCYGAKDLITPNMDALAKRGTRFTQFYVGASLCSPSRAALLTGRFPQRAQLPGNARSGKGLPSSQVTIAEILKKNGYKTGIFGKWHLGTVLPLSPNEQGFDEFLGHKEGCIDNYSHFYYWRGPNRHDLWKDENEIWESGNYFPNIIVREAKRFLEENKAKPFFLYLPFNTPHYPMQAEQKFVKKYENIKDPNRKRYAAFVSSLDDKIGQVMVKLDELNLRENTIVIFMSDHGHSIEERAFGGGGSAGPYRGHKKTMWEGGIRVPSIVSWPGQVPEGAVRDQIACSIDWLPTIAEYCGVTLPNRKIDGKSIVSLINSAEEKSPHEIMHWMLGKTWAVRQGKWKLVYDKELFLSNMEKDVTETKNLAKQYPNIVNRLKKLHVEWVEEVKQQ